MIPKKDLSPVLIGRVTGRLFQKTSSTPPASAREHPVTPWYSLEATPRLPDRVLHPQSQPDLVPIEVGQSCATTKESASVASRQPVHSHGTALSFGPSIDLIVGYLQGVHRALSSPDN